jgi:RNA polymerase sigma-70 factor (ECF subfamily)
MLRQGSSPTLPNDAADKSPGKLIELVRAHGGRLARFFGRHAPDKSEVPDLVQDVYLKLSKIDIPDHLDNAGSYVISVARSVLVDHQRRRKVRNFDDQVPLFEEVVGTDLPIERVLDGRSAVTRMHAALLALPQRTRDVFALRTIRNMKMAEVAEAMQISLSTAEKHHARALAHLADQLEDFRW